LDQRRDKLKKLIKEIESLSSREFPIISISINNLQKSEELMKKLEKLISKKQL